MRKVDGAGNGVKSGIFGRKMDQEDVYGQDMECTFTFLTKIVSVRGADGDLAGVRPLEN